MQAKLITTYSLSEPDFLAKSGAIVTALVLVPKLRLGTRCGKL